FRFIAPVSVEPPADARRAYELPPGQHWESAVAAHDRSEIREDVAAVPFVGRADELRRLGGLLMQARAGRRRIVFITGPAGIGKNALVDAFLSSPEVRATASALSVARGACVEQLGPREPYMPVLEALGRLT